jgi:transcriptional regulator with PAS, ATPase and Fis domain
VIAKVETVQAIECTLTQHVFCLDNGEGLKAMKKLFVRDIMAPCVSTLHKDDSLLKFVKSLRDKQLDAIPVVNSNGKLMGIMTKANLYDALLAGNGLETPITDFFTSDVHKFSENMLYEDAAEIVRGCRAGSAIVLDDQEQLLGIVSKSDWIMAMFQNEGRLRNQLQVIYNSMHNGLIAINCDQNIIMVNVSAENTLDIEASQVINQSISNLFPDFDFGPIFKDKKTLLGKNIHRNGKSYLCNITSIVDDCKKSLNDVIGAIIVFQDMTEVERTVSNLTFVTKINNTLQSILDIVYDGIVTIDEKANITMVNRSMERFLNLSSQEMVGMPVTKFIENISLPRVIKTGKPEMNTLHIIKGQPYVISNMPIVTNNKIIGAVGTIVLANLETIKALALKLEERSRETEYFKKMATRDQASGVRFEDIISVNPKMIRAKEDAKIAATTSLNILLIGGSGTGKELFVQAIHNESRRKGKLINVNCAAIPESLLESEFFGYAGGAFSGAQQKGKSGKFTMADRGTLFLDEIGDMGLSLQSKLLRVIQDGSFEPVGSNRTIHVDTRIIAATNRNIEKMVEEGTFRSDLYYRLNTVQIYIPSLTERQEDIMLLFDYFLKKFNTVFGTNIKGCSPEVKNILLSHPWP